MNKIKQYYLIILTLLFLLAISFYFFSKSNSKEVYYVNSKILFEEFKMTRESEKIGNNTLQQLSLVIDSLRIKMEFEPNDQLKSNYLQEIIASQEKIEHINTHFIKEEHDKIWSRIKSYIKDYSEKENCSMIIGSETVSDVLYYNPEIDITQDLLKYINKRYEGFQ